MKFKIVMIQHEVSTSLYAGQRMVSMEFIVDGPGGFRKHVTQMDLHGQICFHTDDGERCRLKGRDVFDAFNAVGHDRDLVFVRAPGSDTLVHERPRPDTYNNQMHDLMIRELQARPPMMDNPYYLDNTKLGDDARRFVRVPEGPPAAPQHTLGRTHRATKTHKAAMPVLDERAAMAAFFKGDEKPCYCGGPAPSDNCPEHGGKR